MPELPEVETIRGHLAPHVEGRTLQAVEILDERWCRPLAPQELTFAVQGRSVERLARRGKYLVWELSDDVYLLMHLRMTGTLLLDPDPPSRHPRVRMDLGDHVLVFDDPRRFGTGELRSGRRRWRRSSTPGSASSRSSASSRATTCTRWRRPRGRR